MTSGAGRVETLRPDGREGAVRQRADARRNRKALLDAAADAFVASGVGVSVRDIGARAGVGMGTIYRHFPTKADLIIAVYQHQVEACAEMGEILLRGETAPLDALRSWVDEFVKFLTTKHGLAAAMQTDAEAFQSLHTYFVQRLVPICDQLLDAARVEHEIRADVNAYELMRGIGNLCIGAGDDDRYEATRMVQILIAGLGNRRG